VRIDCAVMLSLPLPESAMVVCTVAVALPAPCVLHVLWWFARSASVPAASLSPGMLVCELCLIVCPHSRHAVACERPLMMMMSKLV